MTRVIKSALEERRQESVNAYAASGLASRQSAERGVLVEPLLQLIWGHNTNIVKT